MSKVKTVFILQLNALKDLPYKTLKTLFVFNAYR